MTQEPLMASERAVMAAALALAIEHSGADAVARSYDVDNAQAALAAAHDPALGDNASVNRGAFLDAILHFVRTRNDMYRWNEWMAEQLDREFRS